jgi:hypothetical protein
MVSGRGIGDGSRLRSNNKVRFILRATVWSREAFTGSRLRSNNKAGGSWRRVEKRGGYFGAFGSRLRSNNNVVLMGEKRWGCRSAFWFFLCVRMAAFLFGWKRMDKTLNSRGVRFSRILISGGKLCRFNCSVDIS